VIPDYPLTFAPILKERVWGGDRLRPLFGKPVPTGARIGESWEVADRPGEVSVVADGPLAGVDLRFLMREHGEALLGRPASPGERFPWLVKLLDAAADLSLQVHPPASRAAELGGEPKTEIWYVAEASADAAFHVGLRPGVTRGTFEARCADGSVAQCFHRVAVKAGDAMFVPSGRVHALGGGVVVFEIQQSSDTTYRVFDWNRPGLDGRPRELHLGPALASIDFEDMCPALVPEIAVKDGDGVIVRPLLRNPIFDIDVIELDAGAGRVIPDRQGMSVIGLVSGSLEVRGGGRKAPLAPGGFALRPAACKGTEVFAGSRSVFLHVRGHGAA
jgi:mannose-6-phosphate isomerase